MAYAATSRQRRSAPESISLPHSEECERAVLGAILLKSQLAGELDLKTEHFYLERHSRIFGAMRHLHGAGSEIDTRTLQARLEAQGDLDAVGGIAYLAGLDIDLPDIARVEAYAEIVKERFQRR